MCPIPEALTLDEPASAGQLSHGRPCGSNHWRAACLSLDDGKAEALTVAAAGKDIQAVVPGSDVLGKHQPGHE